MVSSLDVVTTREDRWDSVLVHHVQAAEQAAYPNRGPLIHIHECDVASC